MTLRKPWITVPDTLINVILLSLPMTAFLMNWSAQGKVTETHWLLGWVGCQPESEPVMVKAGLWMRILTPQLEKRSWRSQGSNLKFVYWCPPTCLSQLLCLSYSGKIHVLNIPFIHPCLTYWAGAASLLEHDQGAQTHCPSPAWCVMKSQGPSSGWSGRQTQAGPLMWVPTKDGDIGVDSQY